jgi:predicted RNA-binding Zn ribbon-like protein
MADESRRVAKLDLVGGNVGLDFANTVTTRTDYLGTYEDLALWAQRAKILSSKARRSLVERASRNQKGADRAVRRALRLRDAIHGTFTAIAGGELPAATDAARVLRSYGAAMARAQLEGDPARPSLHWSVASTLGGVLDPIAYAAGDLLLAPERPAVKVCPGCPWLFVDRSRNSSRRWCDMKTCGSRDKMRRYYRSRRSTGDP